MPHSLSAHANMPIPKPSLHPREETHHPFPMPYLFPPMPPVHMFLHRFRLSVRDLFFRSDRYTEDLQSQADKNDCRSALHALPDSPGQFRFSPDPLPHLPVHKPHLHIPSVPSAYPQSEIPQPSYNPLRYLLASEVLSRQQLQQPQYCSQPSQSF